MIKSYFCNAQIENCLKRKGISKKVVSLTFVSVFCIIQKISQLQKYKILKWFWKDQTKASTKSSISLSKIISAHAFSALYHLKPLMMMVKMLKNDKNYEDNAKLFSENLKDSDRGSYRCRVDFKKSPAQFHHVFLEVSSILCFGCMKTIKNWP